LFNRHSNTTAYSYPYGLQHTQLPATYRHVYARMSARSVPNRYTDAGLQCRSLSHSHANRLQHPELHNRNRNCAATSNSYGYTWLHAQHLSHQHTYTGVQWRCV